MLFRELEKLKKELESNKKFEARISQANPPFVPISEPPTQYRNGAGPGQRLPQHAFNRNIISRHSENFDTSENYERHPENTFGRANGMTTRSALDQGYGQISYKDDGQGYGQISYTEGGRTYGHIVKKDKGQGQGYGQLLHKIAGQGYGQKLPVENGQAYGQSVPKNIGQGYGQIHSNNGQGYGQIWHKNAVQGAYGQAVPRKNGQDYGRSLQRPDHGQNNEYYGTDQSYGQQAWRNNSQDYGQMTHGRAIFSQGLPTQRHSNVGQNAHRRSLDVFGHPPKALPRIVAPPGVDLHPAVSPRTGNPYPYNPDINQWQASMGPSHPVLGHDHAANNVRSSPNPSLSEQSVSLYSGNLGGAYTPTNGSVIYPPVNKGGVYNSNNDTTGYPPDNRGGFYASNSIASAYNVGKDNRSFHPDKENGIYLPNNDSGVMANNIPGYQGHGRNLAPNHEIPPNNSSHHPQPNAHYGVQNAHFHNGDGNPHYQGDGNPYYQGDGNYHYQGDANPLNASLANRQGGSIDSQYHTAGHIGSQNHTPNQNAMNGSEITETEVGDKMDGSAYRRDEQLASKTNDKIRYERV